MGRRIVAGLFLVAALAARAAVVEETVEVPVDLAGAPWRGAITVTVFRDDARAKSPFLVLNHGRAGTAAGRRDLGRARYGANAEWFVARGFAVFVPTRVGYGVTGGPDLEDTGRCDRRDFPRGFEAVVSQSLAVVAYAKARPYVDAQRGVLAGQSFGGAGTLALAARNVEGVRGAINFAGGSGGDPDRRPADPCSPDALAATLSGYGRAARVPTLWLYSENDRYWGPDLPRRWFEAYRAQGGAATFVALPPSGRDGHASFTANPGAWRPAVAAFLASLGFPD